MDLTRAPRFGALPTSSVHRCLVATALLLLGSGCSDEAEEEPPPVAVDYSGLFEIGEATGIDGETPAVPAGRHYVVLEFGLDEVQAQAPERIWLWGSGNRNKMVSLTMADSEDCSDATEVVTYAAKVNVQQTDTNEAALFFKLSDPYPGLGASACPGLVKPPWGQSGPEPIFKIEEQQIFGSDTTLAIRLSQVGGEFELRARMSPALQEGFRSQIAGQTFDTPAAFVDVLTDIVGPVPGAPPDGTYAYRSTDGAGEGELVIRERQVASRTWSGCPEPGHRLTLGTSQLEVARDDAGGFRIGGEYQAGCGQTLYRYVVDWTIGQDGKLSGTQTGHYGEGPYVWTLEGERIGNP